MRITDNLVAQNYKKSQEEVRKKEDKSVVFEDEVDGYYMYMNREPSTFINDEKGVFDTTDLKSLNTAPSVFDRTAIFRTRSDREGEQ